MNLKTIKSKLIQLEKNALGWRTNRKIVVFESDDWGSIRMPSRDVYEKLLKEGIPVDKSKYTKYDSLESERDLDGLFKILEDFRDKNGNHPVFTANCVVANPEFDKISESGFKEYFYEPITETFKRYPGHHNSFEMWKEGLNKNIFFPQFHGREHLNVTRWLKALQSGSEETKIAFEHSLFGLSVLTSSENRRSYMAAFEFDDPKELETHKEIIKDGLALFEKLFGYKSESFIAPNNTWHPDLAETLAENGVRFIQGGGQKKPLNGGVKLLKHQLGDKNKFNQIFLMRNCQFEPTSNPKKDWVKTALDDIKFAFLMHKPAVIGTHRINYIGNIHKENSEKNNALLRSLLKTILKQWPDVEFMTSVQLGNLINKGKK